jgi:ATP-dependent RNA helicase RhlE
MTTFNDLGLHSSLVQAVHERGYTQPTPIQEASIPVILKGSDLFATAPTGTGKTAAFAIPILQQIIEQPQNKTQALVLAPTRELAHQISDNFHQYASGVDLNIALVYGGVSQYKQVKTIQRGCQVIIATPGRLLDLIEQGFIDLSGIRTLVLDECDRMLDMGFIGDIRRIGKLILTENRQTLLFSATAPYEIKQLASEMLQDPESIDIMPKEEDKPKITQWLFAVDKSNKNTLLTELLEGEEIDQMLIFTRTKFGADKLVKYLKQSDMSAVAIHGDKSQKERSINLDKFKSGRARILVATDVAARGVDVKELSYVLNYDLAQDADTHTHRIGRTGRAGAEGIAVSFCAQDEVNLLEQIYKVHGQDCMIEMEHDWRIDLVFRKSGNRNRRGQDRPNSKQESGKGQPAYGNVRVISGPSKPFKSTKNPYAYVENDRPSGGGSGGGSYGGGRSGGGSYGGGKRRSGGGGSNSGGGNRHSGGSKRRFGNKSSKSRA